MMIKHAEKSEMRGEKTARGEQLLNHKGKNNSLEIKEEQEEGNMLNIFIIQASKGREKKEVKGG